MTNRRSIAGKLIARLLAFFLFGGMVVRADEGDKTPPSVVVDAAGCRIESAGRSIKPATVSDHIEAAMVRKTLRIRFGDGAITGVQAETGEVLWKATKNRDLIQIADDESSSYFTAISTPMNARDEEHRENSPPKVHRLDLTSGKWLPPWAFATDASRGESVRVEFVATNGGQVAILQTGATKAAVGPGILTWYAVHLMSASSQSPVWSKKFTAEPNRPLLGSTFWSDGPAPAQMTPAPMPLTWLGDDLLVCAGPEQSVVRLDRRTGKIVWRIERLWEFERRISNSTDGICAPFPGTDMVIMARAEAEPRKIANKPTDETDDIRNQRYRAIISGPVVVRIDGAPGNKPDHTIFVAVAKGRLRDVWYFGECTIYEIDSGGNVLAMTSLPRMVSYPISADDGAVVWLSVDGGLARVSALRERGIPFVSDAAPSKDRTCPVDWIRSPPAEARDVWFSGSGSNASAARFGDDIIVSSGACWVVDEKKNVLTVPLTMTDAKTGTSRPLTVQIPFKGDFAKNVLAAQRLKDAAGRVRLRSNMSPIDIWIRESNSRLQICLNTRTRTRYVEFDIGELRKAE